MTTVLITLIQNASLLLAMMVVFDLVPGWKQVQGQGGRQVASGVIFGGLCVGLMLASFRLETGIIFDTRSVLLSLSGLFLGPVPTVIAMVIAAVYRFSLGGTGIWTGIGVILATGGIGILWRHYRPGRLADISFRELYGFGVVVHLVMLALMLTLPWAAAMRVLGGIGLPVLLVYPITTVALGWLLAARYKREDAIDAMSKSEARYRSPFEVVNVGKSVTLPATGEIEVNQAYCDILGYTREELRGKTWQELTPPEDIGPINERLAPLFRGEKNGVRFEKRYIHKNNSIVWGDLSATTRRDIDGNLLAFIVTVVDITERKHVELKLQRFAEEVEEQRKDLDKRLHQSVNAISKIAELRDIYTAGHQKRVAELACVIGREMGLADEKISSLTFGGLLHDVGKFFVPSDILNKPGKVSALEYQILQTHVVESYNVVKEIDFPKEIHAMIYQHHERLDGSGYPQGLSGAEIILESRIMAVADVVEAMSTHRPYRPALGIDAALEEIDLHKGTRFDADVVDTCISLFREKKFKFNEQ